MNAAAAPPTTDQPLVSRPTSDDAHAALQKEVTLLELVDRLLDKGVVLSGDITLSVAEVDLVYVGLRVLISSVETAQRIRGGNPPVTDGTANDAGGSIR
jgi:gas vesicle structural protein